MTRRRSNPQQHVEKQKDTFRTLSVPKRYTLARLQGTSYGSLAILNDSSQIDRFFLKSRGLVQSTTPTNLPNQVQNGLQKISKKAYLSKLRPERKSIERWPTSTRKGKSALQSCLPSLHQSCSRRSSLRVQNINANEVTRLDEAISPWTNG